MFPHFTQHDAMDCGSSRRDVPVRRSHSDKALAAKLAAARGYYYELVKNQLERGS